MEDYFDEYDYDEESEYDYDEESEEGNDVTCKRCGKAHLDWHNTGTRWRLLNPNGTFHVCSTVASADDFEDIS